MLIFRGKKLWFNHLCAALMFVCMGAIALFSEALSGCIP
jgi:hypothetical protein